MGTEMLRFAQHDNGGSLISKCLAQHDNASYRSTLYTILASFAILDTLFACVLAYHRLLSMTTRPQGAYFILHH